MDKRQAWYDGWAVTVEKGGPGSGNWGHAGNPPHRGGSAPGGGLAAIGAKPGSTAEERKKLSGEKRGGGKGTLKEIPKSTWNGKSEKLTSFKGKDEKELKVGEEYVTDITKYGDIVFVGSNISSSRYGSLYTTTGYLIPSPFNKAPINGRVKEAKGIAQKIATITDFTKYDQLNEEQQKKVGDQIQAILNTY